MRRAVPAPYVGGRRGEPGPGSDITGAEIEAAREDVETRVAALADAFSPGFDFASIGDSHSQRNGPWGYINTSPYVGREAWFTYAAMRAGSYPRLGNGLGQFNQGHNFAVSGKRADEMVTEQIPQVLALSPLPAYCTVLAGTNDITQGRTSSEIITSLDDAYTALAAVGVRVIAGTIPPSTTFTSGQNTVLHTVNAWIKDQPTARRGVYVFDVYTALVDAAGTPRTGAMVADAVHFSAKGAALIGRSLGVVLAGLLPRRDPFPGPGDPRTFGLNPFMTGTGGYLIDGVTGTVADMWSVGAASGSPVAACSKVARTDGVPGEWQQVSITSGSVRVLTAVNVTTGWTVGDVVRMLVEFETDAAFDASPCNKLEAFIASAGSSNTAGVFTDTGVEYDGAEVALTTFPRAGVLITPPMQIGAGTTGLTPWVRAYNADGGTLRVGRVMFVKV